jgi:hypothetical protein
MSRELYCYSFPPHVPIEEVEATLLLAIWGTESLHGEAQKRTTPGRGITSAAINSRTSASARCCIARSSSASFRTWKAHRS